MARRNELIREEDGYVVRLKFNWMIVTGPADHGFETAFWPGWKEGVEAANLGTLPKQFVLAMGEELGTCAMVKIVKRNEIEVRASTCVNLGEFYSRVQNTAERIFSVKSQTAEAPAFSGHYF